MTAETLMRLEHQGLFMPLPYNQVKTGLPYFKKELFRLYPTTSLLSHETQISLIRNILPLAIENNTRFNIFVSSCNVNFRNFDINARIQDNSTGLTQFLSKGKEFLFLISSLSSKVRSCLGKYLSHTVFQGKETAFNFVYYVNENTITEELVDSMIHSILCLKHEVFLGGYTSDISDNYNYETILPYFLGPIIPSGANIHTSIPNELILELNKQEPFANYPNPKQVELYAMAKLYLIQELVDNLGTILEIAASMLAVVEKVYLMFIRHIDNNTSTYVFSVDQQNLFKNNRESFLRLFYFLDVTYTYIYSYYLPRLQNNKENKKPAFRAERFINKPFYVKFMKAYKKNSLFFDEHTNFMHESSSYENVNPYKYKQRVNMDEIRDRMPSKDKEKFLSSSKSPRVSNAAKDRLIVSL